MERATLAKSFERDLKTAVLNRIRLGNRLKPGLENEADLESAIEWEANLLAKHALKRFDDVYDELVREAAATFINEVLAA